MRALSFGLRAGAAAFAVLLLASPALAVTCAEARGLSAADLRYWAERLQVSPSYLAALLDKAFCDAAARPGSVIARDDKRGPRSSDKTSDQTQ